MDSDQEQPSNNGKGTAKGAEDKNDDVAKVHATPQWTRDILTVTSFVLVIIMVGSSYFAYSIFSTLETLILTNTGGNPVYTWSAMGMLGLISLRILGIFFGATIMLAGTATAFYSSSSPIQFAGDSTNILKMTLATKSPGLVSVVAGAIVICVCVAKGLPATYHGEPGKSVGVAEIKTCKGDNAGMPCLDAPQAAKK